MSAAGGSSPARRALAEREQQRRSARIRHRRQAVVGLLAAGVTLLALVAAGMDRLLRPGAFPIKELRLEGAFVNLDPAELREIIVAELGGNYFSLDLARIEEVVEAQPWVRTARVRRSWPNSLGVTIEEQRPVARWGEGAWLNAYAEIVRLGDDPAPDGLVALSGPDSSARQVWRRYNEWLPMLRGAGLTLESIHVDDRFAWILRVVPDGAEDVADVLLGTGDHDSRVRRLIGAYPKLPEHAGAVLTLDMRYPNGLAITADNSGRGDDVALNEVDQ